MTVLLLSLQFHAALRFLWKDETTKMYRMDSVHMAIVMHQEDALLVLPGAHWCHRQGMRCGACCDPAASLLLWFARHAVALLRHPSCCAPTLAVLLLLMPGQVMAAWTSAA